MWGVFGSNVYVLHKWWSLWAVLYGVYAERQKLYGGDTKILHKSRIFDRLYRCGVR